MSATESETYVVVKCGAFHQGTWGPFGCARDAAKRALELAAQDIDNYHDWEVLRMHTKSGLGEAIASFDKVTASTVAQEEANA